MAVELSKCKEILNELDLTDQDIIEIRDTLTGIVENIVDAIFDEDS